MLYVFDKDGTLVGSTSGHTPNKPEEQFVLPGVCPVIEQLHRARHELAIASNQGGVAWGRISLAEAINLAWDAALKASASPKPRAWWQGSYFLAVRVCPYDPRATGPFGRESINRKPGPGMLQELMSELGYGPTKTVFVGNAETDRQAAEAAGVRFEWAASFFGWGEK